MVLPVSSGRPRLSRPHAEDPRQRSWQCSPAPYRRSSYSTSKPLEYPIPPVLQHHVRLLVLCRTVCGTHVKSRVPLPARSVRTCRRSRTLPLGPLPPRTQYPLLVVLVCVRHHHFPSTAGRVPALSCAPAPLRALPPLLVSSKPSLYPLLFSPTPRVLLSCSPPRFSSARPSCTPLAPRRWRTSVLLLPGPTPRLRTSPPAATAPAASEPWASSASPGDSPGSLPGAPLPASSSTVPPPSQAPLPRASLPCRPGR